VDDDFASVIRQIWNGIGYDGVSAGQTISELTATGPRVVLPSAFDVTGLATSAVAAASLGAAHLLAARRESAPPSVSVDSRHASAAFAAEALFTPIGWTRPPTWDPLAGNYRAGDAWIRLHTNYTHHRRAVEQVLGARDRDAVHAALAGEKAQDVESAIVEAGGAAAVMRDRDEWLASTAGAATAETPAVSVAERTSSEPAPWSPLTAELPFEGVRVLDLTRVIAGPVCTTFLAGYGADVLRIDPPGFEEVGSLLPETTAGKRTAALDLTARAGRARFEELIVGADVLVCGLRADALDRLGYDDRSLTALNPGLIVAGLDAYGWTGPWRNRRGFDSLVQMSCGIAAHGARVAGRDEPVPLPVQALDHATGWLLAAAVGNALTRRVTESVTARIHASLIGTANLLSTLDAPPAAPSVLTPEDVTLEDTATEWGPARRVPIPGRIEGVRPRFACPAGPLGRHDAVWEAR
jgi:crotonobetainyl-CoA:carnitine CoA-transferase CaiB-like acyl-CoA transferase